MNKAELKLAKQSWCLIQKTSGLKRDFNNYESVDKRALGLKSTQRE